MDRDSASRLDRQGGHDSRRPGGDGHCRRSQGWHRGPAQAAAEIDSPWRGLVCGRALRLPYDENKRGEHGQSQHRQKRQPDGSGQRYRRWNYAHVGQKIQGPPVTIVRQPAPRSEARQRTQRGRKCREDEPLGTRDCEDNRHRRQAGEAEGYPVTQSHHVLVDASGEQGLPDFLETHTTCTGYRAPRKTAPPVSSVSGRQANQREGSPVPSRGARAFRRAVAPLAPGS
jgi:hypothetical protein